MAGRVTWQALWLPGAFLDGGRRPPVWAAVLGGAAIGLFWGAVARVFMRLISERPHALDSLDGVTVGGTAFILLTFALTGAAAGLAFAALRREWPRWIQYSLRALVAVPAVPIVGQGATNAASLPLGALVWPVPLLVMLAVTRVGWPRIIRGGLLIVALAALLVVSREFMSESPLSASRSATIVPFLAWLAYGQYLVLRVCLEPVVRPQRVTGVSLSAAPTIS